MIAIKSKGTFIISTLCSLFFLCTTHSKALAQSNSVSPGAKELNEPWTPAQLMAPGELAAVIETGDKTKQPLILSVGPAAMIKGSIDIGPASEKDHLEKLKTVLQNIPKDKAIVVYCGCCPFEHCPNIRPAFKLLNDRHFTHAKLLDLENNIRTDWIDKGYPSVK